MPHLNMKTHLNNIFIILDVEVDLSERIMTWSKTF